MTHPPFSQSHLPSFFLLHLLHNPLQLPVVITPSHHPPRLAITQAADNLHDPGVVRPRHVVAGAVGKGVLAAAVRDDDVGRVARDVAAGGAQSARVRVGGVAGRDGGCGWENYGFG